MAVAISAKTLIGLLVTGLFFRQVQAQGTLWYTTYVPGDVVGHVYGPEISDPSVAKVGNTAAETPSGTQVYTGLLLAGSGWSVQLFSTRGAEQSESSLAPVAATITTFRTGAAAGIVFGGQYEIPGILPAETGTFQLRAWDNQGGTLASWLAAEPLWHTGSIAAGKSILFDIILGGGASLAPDMLGFRSFNVYMIPEPGTLALVGLGGAAFLLLRRRLHRR